MWTNFEGKAVSTVGRGHIPYGYYICDGKAVANEEEVKKLLRMYEGYLAGLSLVMCAKQAGINCVHGSAAKLLENKKYLGDDYYPQIIEPELYEKVNQERKRRAIQLGRMHLIKEKDKPAIDTNFRMKKIKQSFSDPFKQAEYVYSLIESEDKENVTR